MTPAQRLWFAQNEYRQPSKKPFGLGAVAGQLGATIYRFIVVNLDGSCDTGANYPGCSSALGAQAYQSGSPCDPQHFASVNDAIAYAVGRGETPYQVSSGQEAFNIIAGQEAINPAQILTVAAAATGLSMTTWLLIGVGAFLLLGKKKAV